MPRQLPLNIRLRASATFGNFYAVDNQQLIAALQSPQEGYIYLWGAEGSGKTHLLQAVCHAAANIHTSTYLPLSMPGIDPAMLEGLEGLDLVCVDDVQTVAGNREWEMALFHLYNRLREAGRRLIIAATAAPASLAIRLPDLATRLSWGSVYQVHALDDTGKKQALQIRAREQGVELPGEVVDYLLRRYSRDPGSLFELLERLDEASLVEQRRLSIPFVSKFLDQLS